MARSSRYGMSALRPLYGDGADSFCALGVPPGVSHKRHFPRSHHRLGWRPLSVERDSRMPIARRATIEDLELLLDLFRASDVSAQVETIEQARDIWRRTITQAGVTVFVSEAHPKIVATCMLITAPNLLRQGRSHAFLENVVTHPAHQGQGHGRAVVEAALAQAWSSDCHHVLMQSGRADPRVHRFYERCGFKPGLRTAYVARRPL